MMGGNIHFRSVRNKYLRVTGYNLEGISTESCDNFRGRDHSCIIVASSLSKTVQVFLPITVFTCHGSYKIVGLVISGKVYGFHGHLSSRQWPILKKSRQMPPMQKLQEKERQRLKGESSPSQRLKGESSPSQRLKGESSPSPLLVSTRRNQQHLGRAFT
ncbi:hypothetical protein Tco_0687379 [Tanacetum coccineum]